MLNGVTVAMHGSSNRCGSMGSRLSWCVIQAESGWLGAEMNEGTRR